ncbi:MAG: SMP-30/gluconolactonase/LRE family protein [Methylophilaceae bacterium]
MTLLTIFSTNMCFAEVEILNDKPLAAIDLATPAGVAQVKGQWRYSDTKIIETSFFAAGADGQPGSQPVKTYDYEPKAGRKDFDDKAWEVIDATTLSKRRTNGHVAFNWYRINITVPEKVGDLNATGNTLVFETSADDYAEIWVDGELSRAQAQSGGSVIKGWNAINRLVVGHNVKPGQQIQLAIFGINGPISASPTNYIYLHHAKLEFYPGTPTPYAVSPQEVNVDVLRSNPAIDNIVPLNPKLFKLAEGFQFTEGPIWLKSDGGKLLFSDPNANTIYQYSADNKLTVFKTPSGYSGSDITEYKQPGSNGITLDKQGRITIDQHGNRRVIRLEADGSETIMADKFDGKRFNSPNDLVYKSDGALYVTDPPFGLPKFNDDPRKELAYSGVYRVKDGKVQLLTKELSGPNGIAFSPDEKYLYIGNWDDKNKVVMRYPVRADGTLDKGTVFFDMTSAKGEDAIDGIKVDMQGNLYVSGPGGLWIISAQGKNLGMIIGPKHPHNMAWGDADGKTLYLAAQSGLYKIKLNIAGIRPQ